MESAQKHVVFDTFLKQSKETLIPSHTLCVTIKDLLLLQASTSSPSSVSDFVSITAATGEGSISINVLKEASMANLSPIIENQIYADLSGLSIRKRILESMNSTFQSISNNGEMHQIVILNFWPEMGKYNEDYRWIVLFNPIYLRFSPLIVSMATLGILSSAQTSINVDLDVEICPYIFRSNFSPDSSYNDSLKSRSSILTELIHNYFTDNGLALPFYIGKVTDF